MKTLLLMRHAKSSWKDQKLADHERPLKKRGRKDTVNIAKFLIKNELIPDLIFTSSAVRAMETAELIVNKMDYEGKLEILDVLYMAEPETYIEKINTAPEEVNQLMVVGHNPGIETLVQYLGDKIDSMPTGAVAVIVLPINSWNELDIKTEGELSRMVLPSDLRK
jgi:phosphohistidine phosphatase